MVNAARELLEQLKAMTDPDAPLNASLREVRQLLQRPTGATACSVCSWATRPTGRASRPRWTMCAACCSACRAWPTVPMHWSSAPTSACLARKGWPTMCRPAHEARDLLVGLRATLQRVDGVLAEVHGGSHQNHRNIRVKDLYLTK